VAFHTGACRIKNNLQDARRGIFRLMVFAFSAIPFARKNVSNTDSCEPRRQLGFDWRLAIARVIDTIDIERTIQGNPHWNSRFFSLLKQFRLT
jgi:hypothetical protein